MKWLFVDHACHRRTHSADFFLDVLRKSFEVFEHYYDRFYETGTHSVVQDFDGVISWEFLISRNRFFVPGKRNVFVPMYDNEWASRWQWRRISWSGIGVISFCDKVSAHARKCGVSNLLDVRFFPNPKDFPQEPGDSKRVFLWERGDVTRAMAERLFPAEKGYVFDVKGANEFLSCEDYLARIAKCGIVIAPRRKEGIGMVFLEAMAMGKCVVAHNDATMNEYIKDGAAGILFDADAPHEIDSGAISCVRSNMQIAAAAFHAKWLSDREKINDFIAAQPICALPFVVRLKLALAYPLFLVEGAKNRFFH
jgi:hypothetical protein